MLVAPLVGQVGQAVQVEQEVLPPPPGVLGVQGVPQEVRGADY